MKTETLEFDTANGATTAYATMPDETNERTKAVILIQEYWGLAEHIKDIARRYADEGFICIAPDLYRGKLTDDSDKAAKLMQNLAIEDGIDTIKNAIETASEKYGNSHFGITGYCMGGTYALRAACELSQISAAAPFYGDIPPEDILKELNVPTIFISGTKDGWINPEKVAKLEEITSEYELPLTSVKYEADHAFFNDTNSKAYDKAAAEDAWAKVIQLFNNEL
ncbi:MAG: dienelactone hydrolase family protein [Aridibacter sp.]